MTIYTFNLLVGFEPNGVGKDAPETRSGSEVCLYHLAHSRKIGLLPLIGAPG
jgi:hypothetical protein